MEQQANKIISEEKIIAEFADRQAKTTRLAIFSGIITVVVFYLLYEGIASDTMAVVFFIAIFFLALFVHLKIWRCPSCDGHLGRLYLGLKLPKHCPNCGIKLVESGEKGL